MHRVDDDICNDCEVVQLKSGPSVTPHTHAKFKWPEKRQNSLNTLTTVAERLFA